MRQTATKSPTLLPSAICGLFTTLLFACVPAAVSQIAPSTGMEGGDSVGADQPADQQAVALIGLVDRMKATTGIAQDGAARAG